MTTTSIAPTKGLRQLASEAWAAQQAADADTAAQRLQDARDRLMEAINDTLRPTTEFPLIEADSWEGTTAVIDGLRFELVWKDLLLTTDIGGTYRITSLADLGRLLQPRKVPS